MSYLSFFQMIFLSSLFCVPVFAQRSGSSSVEGTSFRGFQIRYENMRLKKPVRVAELMPAERVCFLQYARTLSNLLKTDERTLQRLHDMGFATLTVGVDSKMIEQAEGAVSGKIPILKGIWDAYQQQQASAGEFPQPGQQAPAPQTRPSSNDKTENAPEAPAEQVAPPLGEILAGVLSGIGNARPAADSSASINEPTILISQPQRVFVIRPIVNANSQCAPLTEGEIRTEINKEWNKFDATSEANDLFSEPTAPQMRGPHSNNGY